MADTTITQQDLNGLAQKLDELADVLNAKERDLLLAVFRLAGQTIAAKIDGDTAAGSQKESGGPTRGITRESAEFQRVSSTVLSDGFRGAFRGIDRGDLALRTDLQEVAGGVGIGIVY